jgi:membrane protein implicated in regulation of membrane protease activity
MPRQIAWDEVGIVVALVIAGVLFLSAGDVVLGAVVCVAAVVAAVVLWTPARRRLRIPPSPRRSVFGIGGRDRDGGKNRRDK